MNATELRRLSCLLIAVTSCACGRFSRAADVTSTWTAAGVTANWSDPASWDTPTAPNNGATTYDAVIASGLATVDAPITVDGLALLGSSRLGGPEIVTVATAAIWQGREIGNAGVAVAAGATLDITGSVTRTLANGATLSIAGDATLTGSGNVDTFAGSPATSVTVSVESGGVLDLQSNADFTDGANDSDVFVRYGMLAIAGELKKTTSTGETRIAADWSVNNMGVIAAESGTLRFSSASSNFNNDGTASVAAGATLAVGGGLSTGAWNVAAGGQLVIDPATSAGAQTVSGAIANDGDIAVRGRLDVAPGASYSGSGAFALENGGRLGGTAPMMLANFNWSGGRIDHTGGITVPATGTAPQMTVSGSNSKRLGNGAALTIEGTALVTSTSNIDSLASSATPATVTIGAGGLLDLASDAGLSDGFAGSNPSAVASSLAIDGTLRKSAGGGTSHVHDNWSVENNGLVEATNGALQFHGDFQHHGTVNAEGGHVRFEGDVAGSGNFTGAGTVTMAGSYAPGAGPRAIGFGGDLSLTTANAFFIELGGTTPGSQYDQLSVAGTASLGGTLSVSFVDLGSGLFEPAVGDEFEIISAAAVSGGFSTLALPTLSAGFWQPLYGADHFTLRIASSLPADFDDDGDVDGDDLTNWQAGYGALDAEKADGDENLDGQVTGRDFLAWQRQFTPPAPLEGPAAVAAVPEPATAALLLVGLLAWRAARKR
ncbi:MAG: hypothetical protein CMJ58_04105 [Planctomycetaceae bacterium]|nr:hypothetical protein [Planctomycetaceae bacterium]